MSAWLAAVVALLPPLALVSVVGLRGHVADRLVAVEFATAIATMIFVLMSFAFSQPSLIDLALTVAFLSLPGTLLFTHFVERWL